MGSEGKRVFFEDFNEGVPPAGWTDKRGVFGDARPGYSCDAEGAPDDGTGVKLNATVGEKCWLVTPDIGGLGAATVSCWYRVGAEFTADNLGFLVEASADGAGFAVIGTVDTAGEEFRKAGPFALPDGTRFVRFSWTKIEGWTVWLDAVTLADDS